MFATNNDNKNFKDIIFKIGTIIKFIVIPIAILYMLYLGFKEPVVKITDDQIQIKGMYGLSIDFIDVKNIALIEKSMKEIGFGSRTNGFGGFGDTLKGNFSSNEYGKQLLFVNASISPTILIERVSEKDIYISYSDSKKTEALFMELKKHLP